METIELTPPDNKNIKGNHYIIPIDYFSAKGTKWSRVLIFKAEKSAIKIDGKIYYCRHWANPKYEIKNCGNTGSFSIDGSSWSDCTCDDCVSGRIEVKNGWMPE